MENYEGNGTETALGTLTRRIEQLEKQNRRQKLTSLIVGTVLATLGLFALSIPKAWTGNDVLDQVKARRIILVDENDKARVFLDVSKGNGSISLLNGKDETCLCLTANEQGRPSMAFADSAGKQRLIIGINSSDLAMMGFWDKEDRVRGKITQTQSGNVSLAVMGEDGEPVWKVSGGK